MIIPELHIFKGYLLQYKLLLINLFSSEKCIPYFDLVLSLLHCKDVLSTEYNSKYFLRCGPNDGVCTHSYCNDLQVSIDRIQLLKHNDPLSHIKSQFL